MSAASVALGPPFGRGLLEAQLATVRSPLGLPAAHAGVDLPPSGAHGTRRPSPDLLAKLPLSQRPAPKPLGASAAKPAPYHRIIVIDDFAKLLGLSVNPGDKVPDLSHGGVIKAILNAGVNARLQPGERGHVPIESVQLKPSDADPFGIAAGLQSVLDSAPRDTAGRPDLRGVAINLSQSVFNSDGLPPIYTLAIQSVLAAGADLYVSESNASQGMANQLIGVAVPKGATGRLIGVGGSDSAIGSAKPSAQPSKVNNWSGLNGKHKLRVVSSDVVFKPVAGGGYDLNSDGLADVAASTVKPTDKLTAPFVGRPLSALRMSSQAAIDMEESMIETLNPKLEALAAQAGGKDKLSADAYYDAVESVRASQLAKLGNKLISVADLRALARSSEDNLNLVLGGFDIDQQLPSGVKAESLFVNASALLQGGVTERYRDNLVFFVEDAQGKVRKLADSQATGANTVPANSWAPGVLIPQVQRGEVELKSLP